MASVSMIQQWKMEGRAEGLAEGMALGMVEARRSDLLRVLRVRFPDAPYELGQMVRGMKDYDQLGRWFEAALVAPTVEVFAIMAQDSDARADRQR